MIIMIAANRMNPTAMPLVCRPAREYASLLTADPGQAHRRGEHERPLATMRLGQRPPDLGRRPADLVHTLGGAPEVSMIGRSSTPPPGAGHSLANAKA
jgi:hypothetical protein